MSNLEQEIEKKLWEQFGNALGWVENEAGAKHEESEAIVAQATQAILALIEAESNRRVQEAYKQGYIDGGISQLTGKGEV